MDQSIWISITSRKTKYPTLAQDLDVDVVIIGGGITGLTAAMQLTAASKKVAILEGDLIGNGTTGFSTGNLYVAVQPYYQSITEKLNEEKAKKVANSRKFAIDYIEQIINKHKINCNFVRRAWYIYTDKKERTNFLNKEYETIRKIGQEIEWVNELPFPIAIQKAAKMDNQARLNPLAYVLGLADYLKNNGCMIFENSRVINIDGKKQCVVKTNNATVRAKQIIIATHTPVGINRVQLLTAPYRSYAVAVQLQNDEYPEGNFWDIENPHYALSTQSMTGNKPDVLVIAGSHHKTGQSRNSLSHFKDLENFLQKHFSVKKQVCRWSAQHYHAADYLPYIGLSRTHDNVYEATGFFADGLVYGTLAGILIGEQILGKENPWHAIYQSTRFDPIAAAPFCFKEDTNVFAQYMKDFPLLSNEKPADLQKGEARVMQINGDKYGVFKDNNGQLHIVSAVCPHMKCIVNWNNAEHTWDCPCHGSRFSHEGKYIEGPAMSDLTQLKR